MADLYLNQLNDLDKQVKDFLANFDLFSLNQQLQKLQAKIETPDFWQNTKLAINLSKESSFLQQKITQIETLKNNLNNLQIARELNDTEEINFYFEQTQKQLNNLKYQEYLQGSFDTNNVLLSIHAGAGGLDAQDWASILASMYQAFAKKMKWNWTVIQFSSGEEGGTKSITIKIDKQIENYTEIFSNYPYGLLKEEAGVHRLVRISPFNAGKTRETSFALVEILPQDLDTEIDLELQEKDLRWDYFMASGKGGQSVNTTYSAVRVIHLPTNISATCQNERSQIQNKEMALKYLKNKLVALELQKRQEFKKEIKGNFTFPEWSNQIRSYILHPYKLVKDHRSNWETSDVLDILEQGNLLELIWSLKGRKENK